MYLRCTTWCFDICVHCEMITTMELSNMSLTSHSYLLASVKYTGQYH